MTVDELSKYSVISFLVRSVMHDPLLQILFWNIDRSRPEKGGAKKNDIDQYIIDIANSNRPNIICLAEAGMLGESMLLDLLKGADPKMDKARSNSTRFRIYTTIPHDDLIFMAQFALGSGDGLW
jgi:hypothetical protein